MHEITKSELRNLADDMADWDETWEPTLRELEAALKADSLAGLPLAAGELDRVAEDSDARTQRALAADLAAAGALEVFDPDATLMGRRPKTRVIGGTRYVTGW